MDDPPPGVAGRLNFELVMVLGFTVCAEAYMTFVSGSQCWWVRKRETDKKIQLVVVRQEACNRLF